MSSVAALWPQWLLQPLARQAYCRLVEEHKLIQTNKSDSGEM